MGSIIQNLCYANQGSQPVRLTLSIAVTNAAGQHLTFCSFDATIQPGEKAIDVQASDPDPGLTPTENGLTVTFVQGTGPTESVTPMSIAPNQRLICIRDDTGYCVLSYDTASGSWVNGATSWSTKNPRDDSKTVFSDIRFPDLTDDGVDVEVDVEVPPSNGYTSVNSTTTTPNQSAESGVVSVATAVPEGTLSVSVTCNSGVPLIVGTVPTQHPGLLVVYNDNDGMAATLFQSTGMVGALQLVP